MVEELAHALRSSVLPPHPHPDPDPDPDPDPAPKLQPDLTPKQVLPPDLFSAGAEYEPLVGLG